MQKDPKAMRPRKAMPLSPSAPKSDTFVFSCAKTRNLSIARGCTRSANERPHVSAYVGFAREDLGLMVYGVVSTFGFHVPRGCSMLTALLPKVTVRRRQRDPADKKPSPNCPSSFGRAVTRRLKLLSNIQHTSTCTCMPMCIYMCVYTHIHACLPLVDTYMCFIKSKSRPWTRCWHLSIYGRRKAEQIRARHSFCAAAVSALSVMQVKILGISIHRGFCQGTQSSICQDANFSSSPASRCSFDNCGNLNAWFP